MIFFGSKDIKVRVKNFIETENQIFKNKVVIDLPAGSGETSKILLDQGAQVHAYDLFPEFFKEPRIASQFCDLNSPKLNIPSHSADVVFCQEGIEHIPDQFKLFQNLNTMLKPHGKLFLTTPNLSNLKGKLSFLLHESEYYYKIMPPNELDSIWFGDQNKLYFGHVYLIHFFKIRLLAKISGFKIKRILPTKINYSALFLLFFFYPFILFISAMGLLRAMKKKKWSKRAWKVYGKIFMWNINLNILLGNHLFIELEKVYEHDDGKLTENLFDGKEILRT